ncbi:MAG: hypothetical protein HQ580_06615 [Planctomycetes bacterium]|nr:hypothetical protein [Planctomycetota bacterium]
MEITDYYCPTTVTSTLGYSMGRAVGAARIVTVEAINPVKAGAAVAVVWGGIAALLNARKYKQGRITKRNAVLDTAGEGVGLGLAASLGLLASNAARASVLVASTTLLIPFTVGVAVTSGAKVIWNCSTKKHLKCQAKPL